MTYPGQKASTVKSLTEEFCAFKRETRAKHAEIEHKLDQVLGIIGPNGVLRKHGPRIFAAVMGAAVYAGFIDGKVSMFVTKLLGL